MHKMLIASIVALALAGCNKAQTSSSGSGAPATPTANAQTPLEMPMRKVGLWQQSMLFDGKVNPDMSNIRLCVGPATNAEISLFGKEIKAGQDCQQSISRDLNGSYVVTATCKTADGGVTTSHGTMSGDYSSNVKIHSESNTTGSATAAMNVHSVIDMTMTYLGACPSGMVDGDETFNGMTINLVKTLSATKGAQ